MSKTNQNPDVIETAEAKPGCASVNCYVAAENHTTVAVNGIMLTIAARSDPRLQSVAVLTKQQAAQIVEALCAAHKIEPHNDQAERLPAKTL